MLLYFLLERKINRNLQRIERIRMLKNLGADLAYNYVCANKVLENKREYLESDRFTLNQFRIEGLLKFYYQKPIREEEKFSYVKLLSLIQDFERNNFIVNLVFTPSSEKTRVDNKRQYLENAEKLLKKISEFLNGIEIFFKKENIKLNEYS